MLVLALVCGMIGSIMAIRRSPPPAGAETSLPSAPKPVRQAAGGIAWFLPGSTLGLDRIAAAIDTAGSDYSTKPRMAHIDLGGLQDMKWFAAAAAAWGTMPIGTAAAVPPETMNSAALSPALQPPGPPQNPGNPELQSLLDPAGATAIAGERLRRSDLVRRFYAEHGNEPFWDSHPDAAGALLGAVFRAEDQGLDPALFHVGALSGRGTPLSPVARDILISDAVLSYADAMAEGAVPRRERPWTEALYPVPVDVVAAIDRAIAAPDPAKAVAALAPASPQYEAMRRSYVYYRARTVGAPVTQEQEEAPHTGYKGDDRSDGYAGDRSYDDAARRRRYAHYSYVSRELAGHRARQLAVGLERLRWLPRRMPRSRIVVNTATQQLRLFQDDRPVFSTRVVVGQPAKQTPEFHATIGNVLFNPPWNIPPSILRKEILPKLARDPGYLVHHHMRWHGPNAVQQEAGPHSALGRLKFEMSDPYQVYLHDTPERRLFRLADRMKSHGCVRVEHPQEMAALLLRKSAAAIARGIAQGRTHAEALPKPIDVYIAYQTVIVAPSGAIEFRADPYERDAAIWRLLTRSEPVPMAQNRDVDARRG